MSMTTRRAVLAGAALGTVATVAHGLGRPGQAMAGTTVMPGAAGSAAVDLQAPASPVLSTYQRLGRINNSRDGVLHAGRPGSDRTVWLTFDDGGSWSQVDRILRVLKAYNVRGTFFPTGVWAAGNQGLVRRMKAEGHLVGSHTYNHADLSRCSTATLLGQIQRAERIIGPNTAPKLFRCPYGNGAFTSRINTVLTGHGYQNCYWTCDTQDWSGVSAATIVRRAVHGDRITPAANARGVVLMHMSGRHTGEALPAVITGLRARGLAMPRRS